MTNDHPLLNTIREGISTTGSYSHHWGQLRREVFPGLDSWLGLKAWCAANALECAMAYSQSSKGAHVQFSKLRKNSVAA
jgi:hypothetical protein